MIMRIASLLTTIVVIILIMNGYSVYVAAQQQTNSPESNTASNIYKKVENSIVGIVTPLTEEATDILETTYDGSGFVYDRIENNTVHIVTNEHVVQGFETVKVVFIDGSAYTADVIGVDPRGDIAVLQIVWNKNQQPQAPEPLEIGNSSKLQVGEQVLVIGNPFIDITYTNLLTTGIISKLRVSSDYEVNGALQTIPNAILTDAEMTEGNSGGPLLNMQGQAVGMATASNDETPCCTFAIPSNTITRIVPTLIENGEYIYPYLGIQFVNVTPDLLDQVLGDSQDNRKGVLVTKIDKDSPAHKAGINASITNQFGNITGGDIITAVDGNPITDAVEFGTYVREQKQVDDDIALTVYRNGDFLHLNATLEASPY
jgi:S1-C subfamily serine protease